MRLSCDFLLVEGDPPRENKLLASSLVNPPILGLQTATYTYHTYCTYYTYYRPRRSPIKLAFSSEKERVEVALALKMLRVR